MNDPKRILVPDALVPAVMAFSSSTFVASGEKCVAAFCVGLSKPRHRALWRVVQVYPPNTYFRSLLLGCSDEKLPRVYYEDVPPAFQVARDCREQTIHDVLYRRSKTPYGFLMVEGIARETTRLCRTNGRRIRV